MYALASHVYVNVGVLIHIHNCAPRVCRDVYVCFCIHVHTRFADVYVCVLVYIYTLASLMCMCLFLYICTHSLRSCVCVDDASFNCVHWRYDGYAA